MFPDEIHLMGRLHMFSLRLLKDDLFFFFYTTRDRSVSYDQPNDIGVLPWSQFWPLNPAVHKQRNPFSVKPLWQVALFLQWFLTHALWSQKEETCITMMKIDRLATDYFQIYLSHLIYRANG